MLLRDERQAALNRVESACLENADGYAAAAQRVRDAALGVLFGEAQQQHQRLAAELAPHIRALGDLPRQPDPDRETFGQMVDGLKAFLAADSDAELLEQRLAAETELEQAVQAALDEPLPPDTHDMLLRMLDEIEHMRSRLLNTLH